MSFIEMQKTLHQINKQILTNKTSLGFFFFFFFFFFFLFLAPGAPGLLFYRPGGGLTHTPPPGGDDILSAFAKPTQAPPGAVDLGLKICLHPATGAQILKKKKEKKKKKPESNASVCMNQNQKIIWLSSDSVFGWSDRSFFEEFGVAGLHFVSGLLVGLQLLWSLDNDRPKLWSDWGREGTKNIAE